MRTVKLARVGLLSIEVAGQDSGSRVPVKMQTHPLMII